MSAADLECLPVGATVPDPHGYAWRQDEPGWWRCVSWRTESAAVSARVLARWLS